jgi:outer membrane usher protein
MSTVRCVPEASIDPPVSRRGHPTTTRPLRTVRHVGFALCICAVSWQLAVAQPIDKSVSSQQRETMVVRASLNTVDKGDIFVQRTPDGDFLLLVEDLKSMGFTAPAGQIVTADNSAYLSLRSMPGVSYVFGDRLQTLAIKAEPQLLTSTSLDLQSGSRPKAMTSQSNSAFLNYALDYADAGQATTGKFNLTAETGLRFGDYLFTTNATTQASDGSRHLTRLLTSVTRDDRDNLRRIVAGDFFTTLQGLGNSVNMGGLSISKRYGLDPYFVRNPLQNIRGLAATPSQLELYVDGQRVRSEQIQPGAFELRNFLDYGGATTAQVVLRDAFGQVQRFDYSFYFSDQPLAKGLSDYSYSIGALREDYGLRSNHYGAAAFSAFHRYGFSDAITLGGFAEGKRGMINAGPSATIVLGDSGILSLTLGASRFDGLRGRAVAASYSYQSHRWSLGMELRKEYGSYAVLDNPVFVSNRQYDASLSAAYNVPGEGSVAVSYATSVSKAANVPGQPVGTTATPPTKVTSLTYSTPLMSGRSSLVSRVSRVLQNQAYRNELFIGLNYNFDNDFTVVSNLRKDDVGTGEFLQLVKNQPVGEGLGFSVSGDHIRGGTGSANNFLSSIQYNAPAALLRGTYNPTSSQGQTSRGLTASLAGGIGYVDGLFGVGRPITDSFGVVKVNSLEGVDVSVNGQTIGKTDSRGQLFLPSLSSYYDSDVSIASESVPIEYLVPNVKLKLSPSLRSGSIVNFDVTRLQAFTGSIQLESSGQRRPAEFTEGTLESGGKSFPLQTGKRGEFYLENLMPGSYLATLNVEGKPCRLELNIPVSTEAFVDMGEVVCKASP